ncbi:MAG TPA: ubiquitin-like domain-containing protein [Actinotalea sp.]|nr:ubiquitin-like domain-containing protein [Actinotalea sp.]
MPLAPRTDAAAAGRSRRAPGPAGRYGSTVRLAAQALVLAVVVAGTSAFTLLHKTVTLDVDGERTTVSAFGRTVSDVLSAQGVELDPRDLVLPSREQLVADRSEILVRHGREVAIVIDGEPLTVWTTAQTVGDVVAELDLRDGVRTSASRSAPLGRDVLRLSTLKQVHLALDGATVELSTAGATVREVLLEAGVVLGERDQVSVPLDTVAVDGLVVMVTRVTTVVRSAATSQPFAVVRQDDAELAQGTETVEVAGEPGTGMVTYESYEVDGVEIGRTVLAQTLLTAPVDQVVRVGTKVAPAVPSAPPVEPGTSRAIGLEMVLARGWSADEFACLDALWTRESGWRVNAANTSSGAYGIPQALPGSKMASAGADWQTNPATQIAWGLGYITSRYGTPCGAWSSFQAKNWY